MLVLLYFAKYQNILKLFFCKLNGPKPQYPQQRWPRHLYHLGVVINKLVRNFETHSQMVDMSGPPQVNVVNECLG